MKRVLLVLAALAVAAFAANSVRLDQPLSIPNTDDQLSYDDGTANWLTWGGLYRGTWFNLADFGGGSGSSWNAQNAELWFFHHSSYPWDTASFYCEVYNGDASAPVTQLNQTSVPALHYAACYANYSPELVCEANFWIIANTELSSGGWPSILGDPSPPAVCHSFFSDDFIVWEPWGELGDYFVRTTGTMALSSSTWGSIKALYN